MRKEIHPENYRLVAFKDMSNDEVFITKSTADTKETIDVDGTDYPLVKLEISRTSHPFYTGKAKLVDTAGRIDKFKNKYDKFKKSPAKEATKEESTTAKATETSPATEKKVAQEASKAESKSSPAPEKKAAQEGSKVETSPAPEKKAAPEASKAETKSSTEEE